MNVVWPPQVADHGEMLGDHHMQSKMVFYEGSVHIPLILRLPGVIPAGRVVDQPVSNLALFATFLDYLGLPGDSVPPTSKSLRPLIEGTDNDNNTERVIFSFWDSDISPVSSIHTISVMVLLRFVTRSHLSRRHNAP